jgi:Tfp pilus assembly protein PilF
VILSLVVLGCAAAILAWQRGGASRELTGTALHWRQAREALQRQDFVCAREHLQHCLDSCPAHAETHFLLARAWRRGDDPDSAETHFKIAEALGWSAEDIALERLLARAQIGNLGEIEPSLLERLEENPLEEELIFEALIKGYLVMYRLPQAAHLATRWLKQQPDRWQPWLYRGRAHYLNGALGRAVADYQHALQAQPHHRQGRLWYAGALLLDGRFREALPVFQKYAGEYPDDSAGLLGLANCQLMLKQHGEAQESLGRLLGQQPRHAAGLLLRARLEMDRDAPQQALLWLKKAEAAAPQEVDIVAALVQAYRQLGQTALANRYQQRHDELRKLTRRLDQLRTQILRSPGEIAPRHEAGVVCLRLGQARQAHDWLLAALALDPNHRPTHQALAECFEKMGDKHLAEYHRGRAADPAKLDRGTR